MKTAPMRWLSAFHAADLVKDLGHQRKHVRERNMARLPKFATVKTPEEAVRFELLRRNHEIGKGGDHVGTNGPDLDGASAVCAWLQEGAQSFNMPGLVTDGVRDLTNVPASDLAMPYRTIHLHIPPVRTPEGEVRDVIVALKALDTHDVLFINPMVQKGEAVDFLLHGYLVMNGEYAHGKNLGAMIASSVSKELQRRIKYPDRKGGMPMKDRWGSLQQECHPATTLALLPLVAEALLRIDEQPASTPVWDEAAPPELVVMVARGDQKGKDAQVRLTDLGHIARRTIGCVADDAHGRTVSGHWRRGHERWQRHGPRGSLRKRIRVGPIQVGTPPDERAYRLMA